MIVSELKESNEVSDATRQEVLRRIESMRLYRQRLESQLEKHKEQEAEFLAMDVVEAAESHHFRDMRH